MRDKKPTAVTLELIGNISHENVPGDYYKDEAWDILHPTGIYT